MNERLRQNKLLKWGKRLLLFCGLASMLPASSQAQTYCSPTYPMGGGSWGATAVIINGTNNGTFNHSPASGTSNYLSQTIALTAGSTYSMSINSLGWCGVGVAADFNSDGDFEDAGEVLALPDYIGNSPQLYSFSIGIPSNIPAGSYRIRMWSRLANAGGANNGIVPCGTYGYGRFQDYTLAVTNTATCMAPANVTAAATPSGGNISWTASTSAPGSYRWKVMTPTGNPSTDPAVTEGVASGTSDVVTGLTPLTNYKLYVRSLCSASDSSIWTLAYNINTPCDGTPTGGTASAPITTVCPNVSFNLSNNGASFGTGFTYQWQSSPTGAGTYVDIGGATDTVYTVTNQTAATDYRCVVKCSGSMLSTASSVVTILQSPGNTCYCIPTSTTATSNYITSFSTTGGTTNITNNSTGSGAYNNYSATMSASAQMGTVVNFSLTGSANALSRSIYIDWNQNGVFTDAGEQVYLNTTSAATVTGSFTIPYTATAGNTRMRVRTAGSTLTNSSCGLLANGETEDYTLNVILVSGVCVIPVNLAVSGVTPTTANAVFAPPPVGNAPTSYIYELRIDGTAAGSGPTGLAASNNITGTTINFTGLAPATSYTLFARTVCSVGDSSVWTSVAFATIFDTLTPVPLTGFGADVIADGVGNANVSTNNDVDGASWALLSNDFRATPSSAAPSNSIPVNRTIVTGTRKYILNNYKLNNSLRMPATSSGTIRFLAPKQANKLYIMGVSGSGVSTNVTTIYFRDGSTQVATQGFPDWYATSGGNIVASAVGRINRTNNTIEAGPKLWDSAIVITTANRTKQIDSISFAHTGNVMNVLAVSVVPNVNQACPLPSAIGAVSAVTSGGATLGWTGNGTNANYQVSYGYEGTYANNGTIVSVNGTTGANSQSVSGLDAATNYQIFVRTDCGGGSYSDWIGPVYFTTLANDCNGVPATGVLTATATSVCPNVPYSLTVSNVSTANGITLKWQSSPTGQNNWVTISTVTPSIGTTSYSYSVATQSAGTDYRCIVSCNISGDSSVTLPVTVAQNAPTVCYCTNSYTSNSGYITNFTTTGGITNIANTSTVVGGGYSNYTAQSVSAVIGTSVNFTSTATSTNYMAIYIDWNQDGDFDDAGETAYTQNSTYASSFSGTIAVPPGATAGPTRMRVRLSWSATITGGCTSIANGETEDYTFNAIAQTVCAGVPAPGNTLSTATDLCVSGNSTFTLQNNYITYSGITYQWQTSPDGAGWTNVSGATALTYTATGITSTTKFRCRLICSAGPDTTYSAPATVAVHALPAVGVTPAQAAFCTSGSATLVANGASTYAWSPATGLSATSGASVDATPAAFTTYTVTGTDAFGCVNTATATVGPMSAITPITASQDMCAANIATAINVSPIVTTGGTMEYQLTDVAGAVIVDWQTGTTFNVTPAISGLNTYYVFARNNSCPAALSDTATVRIYAGFDGTVLANNATCANGDGSLLVTNPFGPGTPGGGLVWYSNDFSSATLDTTKAALRGTAASITGGVLQLTPNSGSQTGGFLVKNPSGISGNLDSVKFILNVPQNGADGMSWSFSDDITFNTANPLESGTGSKLTVAFDAYGTTDPGYAGIYLTYGVPAGVPSNRTVTSTMLAYSSNVSWRPATNTQVGIYITPDGKLTLKLGTTTIFNNVQLPAAYVNANRATWQQMFAARTGGVAELHSIDNLNIYYSGTTYVYGKSPANSNVVPSTWQSSNSFSGLTGGDSLDIWIANPSNPATCNEKLGTYGISAPVVASMFEISDPSCVGTDDGYIALGVNASGTYDVTLTKNGGMPYTISGIASGTDGTNDFVLTSVPEGTYTNMKVTTAGGCVSNILSGPVTLTAPAATDIAPADASGILSQPGAGTQYYTDASCNLIAAVTSDSSLGEVTASVTVAAPLVSPSNEPFLGRHYEIVPTTNGSDPAFVTLYFSEDDFTAYNASAQVGSAYPAILANGSNLRITAFHGLPSDGTTGPGGAYDASNSDLLQPSSITWNSTGNWWEVTVYSPNGFSGFFANTNTGTPLNVTLGDISAVNTGKQNRVNWNTKSEQSGDRFQVESSKDSKTFAPIGQVAAKGTAGAYAFVDEKPYTGTTYYRLRMINADGTQKYSKVVHANMGGGDFSFSVYPNPVNSEVTVKVSVVSGTGTVVVSDVTGRTISTKAVPANGVVSVSMNNLAGGVYLIRYQDDAHTETIKVNKN